MTTDGGRDPSFVSRQELASEVVEIALLRKRSVPFQVNSNTASTRGEQGRVRYETR
jgi:hypothetical protein